MHETSAERQARALYRATQMGHPPAVRSAPWEMAAMRAIRSKVEKSWGRHPARRSALAQLADSMDESTGSDGTLITFGDAEVAIDAVVGFDLDVVLGAVVGFFDAVVGA